MNDKGITFILTTHDIGDIESLAKSVIVINHGEIVFNDSIDALKGKTDNMRSIILKVKNPLDSIKMDGVDEYTLKTNYEGDFFINTDIISIADFIANMNNKYGILDVSVTQQPIEKVIKELYVL